jgi:hypothetical protein
MQQNIEQTQTPLGWEFAGNKTLNYIFELVGHNPVDYEGFEDTLLYDLRPELDMMLCLNFNGSLC